MVIATAQ